MRSSESRGHQETLPKFQEYKPSTVQHRILLCSRLLNCNLGMYGYINGTIYTSHAINKSDRSYKNIILFAYPFYKFEIHKYVIY